MVIAQVTPVLTQCLVSSVVQSVLDLPMGSCYLQQPLRIGAALVQACYPIAELSGYLPVSDTLDCSLQLEDLPRVWPVQIVIQLRTGSEYPPLESSMSFVYGLGSGDCGTETVGVRTFILKQCGYILAQLWLVVFDVPYILTTRLYYLRRQLTLGEYRVGCYHFAPKVYRVQHMRGRRNLVLLPIHFHLSQYIAFFGNVGRQ